MKNNWKQYFYLFSIGLFIGAADPIPGVSGGTIAFISGIYKKLISTLKSFNLEWLKLLICFRWRLLSQKTDYSFLVPLFLGVAIAAISIANLIHYLISYYQIYLWALFFGLVFFSALLLLKQVPLKLVYYFLLVLGIIAGYLVVSLVPLETPTATWFIFFCGVLAISALLLPGISGAFILVILGKYTYIIGAIKDPFFLENTITLVAFLSGMAVGLLLFTQLLHWAMKNWEKFILAFLTGLTFGTLKKLWPWKEVVLSDNLLVENNVLPLLNAQNFKIIATVLLGISLAFAISKITNIFNKN